jgi:hypothetical protein
MAHLVTTTCPKCGAHVPVPEGADRATCQYCQTVSLLKTAPPAHAVATSGGGSWFVPLVVMGLLVAGCGVGIAVLFLGSAPTRAPVVTAGPVVSAPAVPEEPEVQVAEAPTPPPEPPAPVLRVRGDAPFFAVDLDGDGRSELVAPVALERASLFAVFDAQTGAERVRTPELPAAELLAVAGGSVKRLVVTTRLGQLHAYDLLSGAEQWTSALADSVLALCTTGDGELHVSTADQRQLLLDLTTGRQSETRAACTPRLARSSAGEDPRDRHDYSAPLGVEAYRCGSSRVMGSASFTVPDACRSKIPSSLDGMVAHRIWKHGAGWLVFGVRVPGRYVPKLAYLERGRVVWSLDVPVANPLDAEQGSTREAALAGTTLAVLYSTESDRKRWITAFDITDGRRVFTQELVGCDRHSGFIATEDAFVVRCDTQLRVLGAADGALRTTIGE